MKCEYTIRSPKQVMVRLKIILPLKKLMSSDGLRSESKQFTYGLLIIQEIAYFK